MVVVFPVMLGFSACERCIECSYTVDGNQFSEELCSFDAQERSDFEENWRVAAFLSGTTARCIEK